MIYLTCHEKLTPEPIWLTSLVWLSAPVILLTSATRGPFSMAHTCPIRCFFLSQNGKVEAVKNLWIHYCASFAEASAD
jgi:hypothetical protein